MSNISLRKFSTTLSQKVKPYSQEKYNYLNSTNCKKNDPQGFINHVFVSASFMIDQAYQLLQPFHPMHI